MAVKRWLGTALDVAQVDTVTVANTWATNDTIDVTIGGGTMTVTVGTAATTDDVATLLAAAINATTAATIAATYAGASVSIAGQQIPELTDVSATASGSVVTITGRVAGVPFSGTLFSGGLSFSETTAGTGSLTHTNDGSGASVRPTGKNWFTDPDNWSTGVAPVNSDVLVFNNNTIPVLYGIEAAVALTGLEYQIDASFTAGIGLPQRNAAGYEEWRPRYLKHSPATSGGTAATVRIGQGEGTGSSRINLDFGTATPTVVVNKTGSPETGATVALNIIGGATGTVLVVNRGIVGIALDGISAAVCDLKMAYVAGQSSDARVYVGRQADVETVFKSGGILVIDISTGTIDSFEQDRGDSGVTTIGGAVVVTALTVNGGVVNYNSAGALTTATVGGTGVLDFSHDDRAKTVTNPVERNSEDSALLDPNKVVGSLIVDYNNVNPFQTGDNLGQHVRMTRGTPA